MIHDLTKRLEKIDKGSDVSSYKWDNGTYLKLDIDKPFKEQVTDNERKFTVGETKANKIEPTDLHKKELIDYFYKRDNKTKVINKDSNKTLDAVKKRFWSRNLAYLNVKVSNYQKEDTLSGFEKEVFGYFENFEMYLEKVEKSGVFGTVKKTKTQSKEEMLKERFEKFAKHEFDYVSSEKRSETNKKIAAYLRENLPAIKEYFDEQEKVKEGWFIIAIHFSEDEEELSYYQNESDLYMLLKQFINNDYNILDEELHQIQGVPNFLFNDNSDKVTLRTKTQKEDPAMFISSEESKQRSELYNFLEKLKYRYKTITPDNQVKEGLHHGIQMRYLDSDFAYLENNPIISKQKIEIETEKLRLLKYSGNKSYGNHNIVGHVMNVFYNCYYKEENEFEFLILEQRDRTYEQKVKNSLDEMFLNNSVKLNSAFEKNSKSAMKYILENSLIDALIQNAIYGFNSSYHKNENERTTYQRKAYLAVNLLMALEEFFFKKESTMSKLLKEDNAHRLETEERVNQSVEEQDSEGDGAKFVIEVQDIKTKEEYYYYLGQLAYYINTKRAFSNKKENKIIEKLKNVKKNDDLVGAIISEMFTVKEKLGLKKKSNSRERAFSELLEKLLEFEQYSEKLTKEDKKHFLLGIMTKNMFFEIKEEEKGEN